ncbi:hypothetical protein FRC12_018029 [Ceratobasidium sp. 428]|nr:hypothetical protein FRC12_018029 [Ceratobasidium sp. 428]
MRLLSIVAFVGLVSAASISSANIAARKTCDPGEGRQSASSGNCITCPANTFGRGGSEMCQTCPGGSSSTGGSSYCTCKAGYSKFGGATTSGECTACPIGQYSAAGAWMCNSCPTGTTTTTTGSSQCAPIVCPAGKYLSGGSCATCSAGKYSGAGATSCTDCPPGTVSSAGSSTCIICPGGFVPSAAGNTCRQCGANTYSSGDQCSPCPNGQSSPPGSSSCGPQPSKRAVQPLFDTCSSMPGYQRCPVWSSGGGSECVDTFNTLDSCGGCVGPDDSFTGKDCSAIPNVDKVGCERGQCKVVSCREGYAPADGACVPKSHSKAKRGALMHVRHESF